MYGNKNQIIVQKNICMKIWEKNCSIFLEKFFLCFKLIIKRKLTFSVETHDKWIRVFNHLQTCFTPLLYFVSESKMFY